MYECYFTFRSITGAQRGQRALTREKLRCSLQRTPKIISVNGCGYALKVRAGDELPAAEALRIWNVDYKKIFRFLSDGAVEELKI